MAKLKKAPGRLIGRWKEEAIAANPGASDEDLANIVNATAKKGGYDYTITPDKVRARKTKKAKKFGRKQAPAPAARTDSAPAPARKAAGGISLEDVKAVKGLVDKIGAGRVEELARVLSK
jgi:hypothetical protein